ncbi:MAG: transposase family protein [Prevotella sp.]|jgi:hypothetical protein|nr:transposase family protein [Prevotella sp.]
MALRQIMTVIRRHFSNLMEELRGINDPRERCQYPVEEIYMACICMFLFKQKSRNSFNNTSAQGDFCTNYHRLFGVELPHMDTVNLFFRQCPSEAIEEVKRRMVQCLLNHKVMHKFRYQGYFKVAIDGTGIHSYDYEPWTDCPCRESKNGKKTWLVNLLEAKLVCSNGFSISMGTEWIKNTGNMDKQDCERKAFIRLSERLKKDFPRLPIMILADGLYPYEKAFEICQNNNWQYLFTFKDGNLKSVWKQVENELLNEKKNEKIHFLFRKPEHVRKQQIQWVNALKYKSFLLNWIECMEIETKEGNTKKTRFVHLSSVAVDENNAVHISRHARMRWKIENEGFNNQKNHGYNLEHKFSRTNFMAMQNYYQCLQIAHMINQLSELERSFQNKLHQKDSLDTVWSWMISALMFDSFDCHFFENILKTNCQLRY